MQKESILASIKSSIVILLSATSSQEIFFEGNSQNVISFLIVSTYFWSSDYLMPGRRYIGKFYSTPSFYTTDKVETFYDFVLG